MLSIFGIFKTHRAVRSVDPQERFFAIRASAFTWLVGIILAVVFLSLSKVTHQVIFLIPAFVTL